MQEMRSWDPFLFSSFGQWILGKEKKKVTKWLYVALSFLCTEWRNSPLEKLASHPVTKDYKA